MLKQAALASSVVISVVAYAGSVSSSSTDNQNGTATITYTVTAGTGETIKDIHFDPVKGTLKTPNGDATGPAGWSKTVTSGNTKQGMKTAGAGIAAGSSGAFSYTFNIGNGDKAMQKFTATLKQVTFTATNDGSDSVTPGQNGNVVFTGGPNGGPVVSFPSKMVNFREPPTTLVGSVGSSIALEFETSFYGGQAFKVHAATALSVSASGESNPLGIGLDLRSPVPESWGLSFTPELERATTYTERSDRLDDGVVTITIPNDASLVGETFYLVVSSSTGGTERDLYSQPMRITIRPSESTNSGVELLPYSF